MTHDQFDALARLLRLRVGPQQDAARLVFVEKMKQADAARLLGISAPALSSTVRRCRLGFEAAKKVCGID